MITITHAGFLDVRQVCDHLGVTPALLRLWENRYGWPSPRRTSSGQRRFTEDEVAELAQVLALVRSGRTIGSLIVDRRPVLPRMEPKVAQPLGAAALGALTEPRTEMGLRLRAALVDHLRHRDVGAALAICHRALRSCHPTDRAAAVREPVLALCQAWADAGRPLAGTEALMAAVDQAVPASAVEVAS